MSKILEVLAKLDVNNDEHWTADGAPRMDVIEHIAGEKYTRDDIKKAAPKFNRATLDFSPVAAQPEPLKQEAPQPWAQAIPEHVEEAPAEATNVVTAKQDKETDAEEADIDSRLEAARVVYDEALKQLEAITAEKDAIIMRNAQIDSKVNQAENIKRFQEQQQEQRIERAKKAQALADLIASQNL